MLTMMFLADNHMQAYFDMHLIPFKTASITKDQQYAVDKPASATCGLGDKVPLDMHKYLVECRRNVRLALMKSTGKYCES